MEIFDFAQNQTVETVEVVPEKYRGLYAEITEGDNAGHYALSEAAAGLVEDYTGLARSSAGLRQEKKTASDESAKRRHELKGISDALTALGVEIGEEGVVPAVEAFIAGLQDQVKGGAQMKVDLEKIKAQFAKQVEDAKADGQRTVDSMMGSLRKHMITSSALAALAKHKGSAELLLPHVESQCELVQDDGSNWVVRVKDPEGTHRINGAGSFMGVEDLVSEMKTKEAFQRAFESESKGGTGSPPGALSRPAASRQSSGDRELSPTEKIRAGLKKGQHQQGRGAGF